MEYEIKAAPLPVAILHLKQGEQVVCDSGAMSWMDPCMSMETTGKGGAVGRLFSGETIFQNVYTATADGKIAFASTMPGTIIPVELEPGKEIIIQKSAFMAREPGVTMEVFFNKKAKTGLFSGEGFIMNKLGGNGVVFLEIDGNTVEYDLAPGQEIICDTGYLAAMDATCTITARSVGGAKNILLGGEGWFNTVITGPGKVILQTMPITKLAGSVGKYVYKG